MDSFEYNSQDSFDTDDEEYDDDESDPELDTPIEIADHSHLNQLSYSWRVITLCVLKIVLSGIMNFLTTAGLEVSGMEIENLLFLLLSFTPKSWTAEPL